jgi:transcriptional regulator with XRE-family HTH domain
LNSGTRFSLPLKLDFETIAMRIPRTKYGLSYSEIAERTGKSRSAVVREAEKDPAAFQVKVNRLIGGPGIAKVPVTQYEYWNPKTGEIMTADEKVDELCSQLEERESDIWCLLTLLCAVVPASNSDLRTALAPLFQTGRDIVRDCPEVEDEKEPLDLRSVAVYEKIIESLLGIAG